MEICEVPSLPMEKQEIPPSPREECPVLCRHCFRSLLLNVMGRQHVWFTSCWSCSYWQFAGGRCTLRSSSRVLLMFGSREKSCWEEQLLSSKEFVSGMGEELEEALTEHCAEGKAQPE